MINAGDGAFYGPKIDIHIKDAIGRTWQCGTIQLDMQLPKRFNCEYVAEDGTKQEPIMLHRVIYGSIDRFMGIITENYAGAFPTWLAPLQTQVISINDNCKPFAEKVNEILEQNGVRSSLDSRNESLSYKIRQAVAQKVPYIIIIGEKEAQSGTISVRVRGTNQTTEYQVNEVVEKIVDEIKNRE